MGEKWSSGKLLAVAGLAVFAGLFIAVLLLGVFVALGGSFGGQPVSIVPTPTPWQPIEPANCNILSLDVHSVDYKAPGTAVGSASCTIFQPNGQTISLSEGTAKNLPGFGTYQLFCTKANYYNATKNVVVNSCGAKVEEVKLADIDTSRDSSYFNQDDGLINSASDAMAVGSSACVNLAAKFNGQEDDGAWSNPQLDYSYASYGGSTFTATNWDFSKWKLYVQGAECTDVTGELGQVTTEQVTFRCPTLKTEDYIVVPGSLTACAATGQNPGAENFTQTWTDADYFLNADTNRIADGGDDASGYDVGGADDTVTVYFS